MDAPAPLPNSERVHHPFSPSKLQMLEACPCFENQQSTLNERAIAGTLAHGVAETGDDHHKLSDDDAAAAAECMDFYHRELLLLIEARNRAVVRLAGDIMMDRPWLSDKEAMQLADTKFSSIEEFTEVYLPIDDCVLEWNGQRAQATTAGYVDRGVIDHTRTFAKLFDWKFGMWPVEEAENNLQAIAYALGLFKKYPSLQKVVFFFKQPHLEYVTSALFTRAQVPSLYLRVQAVVARAVEARKAGNYDAAKPFAGVCNFCANIGKCPRVCEMACTIGKKFYPLEIPDNITPTFCDSPENTGMAMQLATVVKVWAEAYRAQVTDRVVRRACVPPPGYVLSTRAERRVVNESKAREIALQHLTEAEFQAVSPFPGFGVMEEVVSDKAPRGQKKIKVDEFKKALEDSGAVVKDQPYAFLRAIASRKSPETRDETEITDN